MASLGIDLGRLNRFWKRQPNIMSTTRIPAKACKLVLRGVANAKPNSEFDLVRKHSERKEASIYQPHKGFFFTQSKRE